MTKSDESSASKGLKGNHIRKTFVASEDKIEKIKKISKLCGLPLCDVVDASFDLLIQKFQTELETLEVPDRKDRLEYLAGKVGQ